MRFLTRRAWMGGTAAALTAAVAPPLRGAAPESGCTLSIGTYSLKGLGLEAAIRLVGVIGYDGIEVAVQPGQAGDPSQLAPGDRRHARKVLEESGLRLTALMEHLPPAEEDAQAQKDLQRLERVLELGRELTPERRPLVQTVLGGGTWEKKRNLFRDRLGQWLTLFAKAEVVLAIKPHRGGALSRPAEAVWLIEQLGKSRWLRMCYDYSHYAFRDMPLEETIRTALPYTAHIAVKDAAQKDGKVVFDLAGNSRTIDYPRLLRLFYEGGYRGDVCCEVSSMLSNRPDYDPAVAAKTCYANMAAAFRTAGVPRRK